jgi:hypothetical protein
VRGDDVVLSKITMQETGAFVAPLQLPEGLGEFTAKYVITLEYVRGEARGHKRDTAIPLSAGSLRELKWIGCRLRCLEP